MLKKTICGLTILTTLCLSSAAFADNNSFHSEEDFNAWFSSYYTHKQVAKIPAAIKFYCTSTAFNDSDTRTLLATFLAAILKNNNEMLDKTYEEISKSNSDKIKIFTLDILWRTNTTKSQSLLSAAKKQWDTKPVQKTLQEINSKVPTDVLVTPITESVHLDQLWAIFLATGDSAPVKKIISISRSFQHNAQTKELILAGAAKWSLISHAYEHQRVYDICKEELKTTADIKIVELLEGLIKNVDKKLQGKPHPIK